MDNQNQLALQAQAPIEPAGDDIGMLLRMAVDKNLDIDKLQRLIEMRNAEQARVAKMQFNRAMARFHAECPPIPRRTENNQFMVTRNGKRVPRMYASLEDIAKTIGPVLASNGLTYRWTDLTIDGDNASTSCVVTHELGHSESSTSRGPWVSKAGASELQKVGIAQTYLQRYSLVSVLGLTSVDDDNDGNEPAAGDAGFVGLTDDHRKEIAEWMARLDVDSEKFFVVMSCTSLDDMPDSKYADAMRALREKERKMRGAR